MAAPLRLFCGLSGLAVLLGAWALIHAFYGPFVLPRPGEAFAELARLFQSGAAQTAFVSTGGQALLGWLAGSPSASPSRLRPVSACRLRSRSIPSEWCS